MVEQAKNFKVLEAENTELRQKFETLTMESEKSIAAVLESGNHETVRLEKLLALRDKEFADLKKEFDIQKDLAQASASELDSLHKEHAEWNHSVLAPLNLFDSSTSEPHLERIKLVGDVKLSDLHKMPVHEMRDKVNEIPKLVKDWKISYTRTAAQTALTMVIHHSEMEIWHVTKGIVEDDDEGNPQDIKTIQESCAGYACRVAEMTNYTTPLFESVALPPSPQEPEISNACESEIEGDTDVDSSVPPASSPLPAA